jgi:putative membrane protein
MEFRMRRAAGLLAALLIASPAIGQTGTQAPQRTAPTPPAAAQPADPAADDADDDLDDEAAPAAPSRRATPQQAAPTPSSVPPLPTTPDKGQRALNARQFTRQVVINSMVEIEMAKLALSRASRAEVKAFAQEMLDAATKLAEEVQAATRGAMQVRVRQGLPPRRREAVDALAAAPGERFDQDYVGQQLRAHRRAIRIMQRYAESGDHPELRQWAEKTLPRVEEQLRRARELSGPGRPRK